MADVKSLKMKKRTGGRAVTNRNCVKVRMYRQGLGDCFLLSFPRPGRPFHLLIDCGVIQSTTKGNNIMKRVAADIRKVSRGELDVVVISHRHWLSISGFLQAQKTFE